jgi:CRP/FNR family transcriptional regulator, cyclic AMP receptor protein
MVRKDPMIEVLAAIGLFSACNKRELSAVARSCTALEVNEGFVLTTQGFPGPECFVIAQGEAKVLIGGQQVATVGRGECVGEMSLLDKGPRTATVVATTPMRLWVMSRREFNSVLDASATISRNLLVTVAGRLRNAETNRPRQGPFSEEQGRIDLNHTGWEPATIDDRPISDRSERPAVLG